MHFLNTEYSKIFIGFQPVFWSNAAHQISPFTKWRDAILLAVDVVRFFALIC